MNAKNKNARIGTNVGEDAPLSPEQMLALVGDQRRSFEGQVASFVPAILVVWGLAWLFGFSALWLIDGARPGFALPLPAAIAIFCVLLAIAIATSAVLGIRSSRGIRGSAAEAFQGIVYGVTWAIGAIAIVGFAQGLVANGMDRELANIFYPVAFVLFTGLMFIISAAIWHAVPMLILGVWVIVVGVAAPFFGYPTHYLVMALAGGLALLALAVASYVHLARLRRAVSRVGEARRG